MAKAVHLNNADGTRKTRKDFKYLSVGKDKDEAEDIKDYQELMSAFLGLGFSNEEILSIHKIISAVLYIG
jgi:myosin heavy subunit